MRKQLTLQEKAEKYMEIRKKALKKLEITEIMAINFPKYPKQPLLVRFALFIINKYGGTMVTQCSERPK